MWRVFLFILAGSPAFAQNAPQLSPLQRQIEQRVQTKIGELLVGNTVLQAQLEAVSEELVKAQQRIKELEKPADKPVEEQK